MDAQNQISTQDRLAGVDVLRGLCILSVLLHHIHLRFKISKFPVDDVLPETLNQVLFWTGLYAVMVFFVISGFLITGISIRRWGALGEVHTGSFYRMRVARIFPCLLLLLSVLTALYLLELPGGEMYDTRPSIWRYIVGALTFHMNWLDGTFGWAPAAWGTLWSLSVEEVFYVAFPLVCLLIRSEKILPWALLVLIILGPVNRVVYADDQPWGAYAYLSGMDGIAFGCLAALVTARVELSMKILRLSLIAGALMALAIIVFCDEDNYHVGLASYGVNVTVLELGVALMLVALGKGVGNRTMSIGTSWLRALGRWSYEIYLFHMIPLIWLIAWFRQSERPGYLIVVTYVVMLLASIALGFVIHRYFSEPLNQKLRAFRAASPFPRK
jgi:peptidoglycan/LPS O-acetylase OafA/YrhL